MNRREVITGLLASAGITIVPTAWAAAAPEAPYFVLEVYRGETWEVVGRCVTEGGMIWFPDTVKRDRDWVLRFRQVVPPGNEWLQGMEITFEE